MIITEEHIRDLKRETEDIRLYIESQVEARVATLASDLDELREHLAGLIAAVQDQVGSLESEVRRVADLAQNAEYAASDAKRAADEAANTSRRGW